MGLGPTFNQAALALRMVQLHMRGEPVEHMEFLEVVAEDDVAHLRDKERTYKGSWKQRGGVGAFMMLARKWDRLEEMVKAEGMTLPGGMSGTADRYDIFQHAHANNGREGVLAQVGDLRRYLMLVEAELRAQGLQPPTEDHHDAAD